MSCCVLEFHKTSIIISQFRNANSQLPCQTEQDRSINRYWALIGLPLVSLNIHELSGASIVEIG